MYGLTLSAAVHLFTYVYAFVCNCHFGCSYFHSLSGSCSHYFQVTVRQTVLCSLPQQLQTVYVCLKRAALVQRLPIYFTDLRATYAAEHKTAHTFCYTAFWKFNLLILLGLFEDGEHTEERQEKAKQKDVKTQCEMGFKPMGLWAHGLWANGLKSPWLSLVCFGVAAYGFCSV